MHTDHDMSEEPCINSKLLALHASTVCLARTLATSGQLDRDAFRQELANGRLWLESHDHPPGHNVQAFDDLCQMLNDI